MLNRHVLFPACYLQIKMVYALFIRGVKSPDLGGILLQILRKMRKLPQLCLSPAGNKNLPRISEPRCLEEFMVFPISYIESRIKFCKENISLVIFLSFSLHFGLTEDSRGSLDECTRQLHDI